jgi:hypothetical protein
MFKVTQKMPNPEGVVAGGTAVFRIPTGLQFHELYLVYDYDVSTQNVADFTEIRIYLNSDVFQRFSGTQRDKLNQFDGMAASVGVLTIPFDRQGLLTVAGQEETSINTGVADAAGRIINSMYMEIDLDAGMTIAAADLSLYAKVSNAVAGGPGTIMYIRSEQRTAAGASARFQISDLVNPGVNAPDKIALNRITFIPSTGTIGELKVTRNNYDIFDRTDALNRVIQNQGIRTAQAGYYMIDTTENGRGGEVIELWGTTDYRYTLDVSTGMTITALSEYLGVLAR